MWTDYTVTRMISEFVHTDCNCLKFVLNGDQIWPLPLLHFTSMLFISFQHSFSPATGRKPVESALKEARVPLTMNRFGLNNG